MEKIKFIKELTSTGIVQFGDFTLKSGQKSQYYIDLRKIISFPLLLQQAGKFLNEKIPLSDTSFLCGVPYSGLFFATSMALQSQKPMIMVRKEAKEYGTKNLIEGEYPKDSSCILVEDVTTTGFSAIEMAQRINTSGIKIIKVITLVDRLQGALDNFNKAGFSFESVFTIHDILQPSTSTFYHPQQTCLKEIQR